MLSPLFFVEVFILVSVVIGLFWLLNSTMCKRLFSAGKAQMGRVGRSAWNADPIAILEQKRDDQMQIYSNAIKTQVDIRGGLENLKMQVIRREQEVNRLDAKVKNSLNNKDEGRAKQFIVQLQKEKESLSVDKNQLVSVQQAYDNNTKQIKLAQGAFENLKSDIMRLRTQTRSSQMEKQLGDLLGGMNVNFDLDGIAEAKEQAELQINRNRGAAMVQAEIGNSSFSQLEEAEREREDNANVLLQEYKKDMNK